MEIGDNPMNQVEQMIEQLVKTHKYKPVPEPERTNIRNIYLSSLPVLDPNKPLLTRSGTVFATRFHRIAIGDYGAFIELGLDDIIGAVIICQPGQEYRISDPRYKDRVKYDWYTVNDGSSIKLYHQKRGVLYADYKPGMVYVSPFEVIQLEIVEG